MTTFRVHTHNASVDVPAESPSDARKAAKPMLPVGSIITKVKVLKESTK